MDWFRKSNRLAKSPKTGLLIGKQLFQAKHVANAIEFMVLSGAVSGDLAEEWKQKHANKKLVESLQTQADSGDSVAAFKLGQHYEEGEKGLIVNKKKAFLLYSIAAGKDHGAAMRKLSRF